MWIACACIIPKDGREITRIIVTTFSDKPRTNWRDMALGRRGVTFRPFRPCGRTPHAARPPPSFSWPLHFSPLLGQVEKRHKRRLNCRSSADLDSMPPSLTLPIDSTLSHEYRGSAWIFRGGIGGSHDTDCLRYRESHWHFWSIRKWNRLAKVMHDANGQPPAWKGGMSRLSQC